MHKVYFTENQLQMRMDKIFWKASLYMPQKIVYIFWVYHQNRLLLFTNTPQLQEKKKPQETREKEKYGYSMFLSSLSDSIILPVLFEL